MKEKETGRRHRLGGLIVIEIIVCYMAILTVISHACGPEKYQATTDLPLLSMQDFSSFTGETVSENYLQMTDLVPGGSVGYLALVSLEDLDKIQIHFRIDCPAEYVGNVLHVDLYEPEWGYDSDEQEVSFSLQEGVHEFDISLNPGESHPESAWLRFFTLDPADYMIQDIVISPLELAPKVSKGMMVTAIVCLVGLAITGTIGHLEKKNTAYGKDE